jgi:hypothetical protein
MAEKYQDGAPYQLVWRTRKKTESKTRVRKVKRGAIKIFKHRGSGQIDQRVRYRKQLDKHDL